MSIYQGSDLGRHSCNFPSSNKLECARTRRCTLFWPNLLRFLECIHPSIGQLCSHPEAEHESPPSLSATHCIAGHSFKYALAHSNGASLQALTVKADLSFIPKVLVSNAVFKLHHSVTMSSSVCGQSGVAAISPKYPAKLSLLFL